MFSFVVKFVKRPFAVFNVVSSEAMMLAVMNAIFSNCNLKLLLLHSRLFLVLHLIITELIRPPYTPNRTLRSSNKVLLFKPRFNLNESNELTIIINSEVGNGLLLIH